MKNLLDYVREYGDRDYSALPFSDVDAVILARLSYLPYECIALPDDGQALTLGAAAEALLAQTERPLSEQDRKLLQLLPESPRFSGLQLFSYKSETNVETQIQFAAICFRLGPGLTCVAFRGTDSTLVGWKEDFNMTFVCPVPAQEQALVYLERLADETDGELLLTGHSKGGNLAVYGAAFCRPETQVRIRRVYNLDGPGFDETVLENEGYGRICSRIRTLVPQSSIVGMLLGHEEEYTIVHSVQHGGIWQHDVYSWELDGSGFRTLETVNDSSRFVDFTLKAWLAEMDVRQRETFVDTVYGVLRQTNASTLHELGENRLQATLRLLRSARQLDAETRGAVLQAVKLLLQSTKIGFVQLLQNRS